MKPNSRFNNNLGNNGFYYWQNPTPRNQYNSFSNTNFNNYQQPMNNNHYSMRRVTQPCCYMKSSNIGTNMNQPLEINKINDIRTIREFLQKNIDDLNKIISHLNDSCEKIKQIAISLK